jgi:hypothetical protein
VGGGIPTHCGKCKESGMMNLTIPKCAVCKATIPIYGLAGQKATHCKRCKTDDLIDVKTAKCKKCNLKQPAFGREAKKPEFCADCKEPDMKDVRSKMCDKCGVKQPVFGYSNEKANRCADCKESDMVDIKSTKCIVCKVKFPVYGIPGGKNTHCRDCKTDDHIDVKNMRCIACNKHQATYGNPETRKIIHCRSCKIATDIDLRHQSCKSEYCTTRGYDKYDGYCAWCFQHLFPEDMRTRSIPRKSFEIEVASSILTYDSSYKHDKRLEGGGCDCLSRRRIDFWKVIGNTLLAIEVDENQHRRYDPEDEEQRYDDLFMVFSGKWIFIRFNPNAYRVNGKSKNIPLKERLPTLLDTIRLHEDRILKEKNTDLVEIHRLFFDS